jgi:hypothetical protein
VRRVTAAVMGAASIIFAVVARRMNDDAALHA